LAGDTVRGGERGVVVRFVGGLQRMAEVGEQGIIRCG